MNCHAGQSEVITDVFSMDEAVLPMHGHLGAPYVGMVYSAIHVVLQF